MSYFYFFQTFSFIIFAIDLLERRFPNEFQNILGHLIYYTIYIYSNFEIYIKRFIEYLWYVIENSAPLSCLFEIAIEKDNKIEVYYNTTIMDTILKKELNDELLENWMNTPFDFLIYTERENSSKINYKKIFHKNKFEKEDMKNISVVDSNISFIMLEIKINEHHYKIDLKNDNLNFYVVDNLFDKSFFVYYITNILKKNIENIDTQFDVKLIDHNVNIMEFNINYGHGILLEKNGYQITMENN